MAQRPEQSPEPQSRSGSPGAPAVWERRRRWACIVGIVVAFALGACAPVDNPATTAPAGGDPTATVTVNATEAVTAEPAERKRAAKKPEPEPTPGQASAKPAKGTALAALAGLKVGLGGGDGYERELFGESWADVDGNGCDTRNDILVPSGEVVVSRERRIRDGPKTLPREEFDERRLIELYVSGLSSRQCGRAGGRSGVVPAGPSCT